MTLDNITLISLISIVLVTVWVLINTKGRNCF